MNWGDREDGAGVFKQDKFRFRGEVCFSRSQIALAREIVKYTNLEDFYLSTLIGATDSMPDILPFESST